MAEEQKSCSWQLQRGDYLGEISALCFLHLPLHLSSFPLLLAGTGSQVLLYDVEAGKILSSFLVFEGIRVHGICCSIVDYTTVCESSMLTFKVAVFGEKRVKLFSLNLQVALKCQDQLKVCAELVLIHSLPKFNHWVLDVCFLKGANVSSEHEGISHIGIGLSDNSVCVWDISRCRMAVEVRCPERTLLYSMRLWGDNIDTLRVACGTIYNEVIVWNLAPKRHVPSSISSVKEFKNVTGCESQDQNYEVVYLSHLVGHEGSIFRIAWSSDGSKLISVSDDRSAHIWTICALKNNFADPNASSSSPCLILFGHNARVWDCYISDSFIITAGEDCTCRVWGMEGNQLMMIKEHIGRGIWRCAYDPSSSLLITAGFDSAIKVHLLDASFSRISSKQNAVVKEIKEKKVTFTITAPNLLDQLGLMDSKSEYVRCLRFAREYSLYVSTNHGYLHHVKLSDAEDTKWTKLFQTSIEVPIVCMDLLSISGANIPSDVEDWIVLGDGKGNVTVVRVVDAVSTSKMDIAFTWSAGKERQLLGTYWCKSLGHSYVFTADPRGILKLWRINYRVQSGPDQACNNHEASLIAQFPSCFGTRILCLDASFDDEVLVCGDQRGNLIMFTLSKNLQFSSIDSEMKICPLNYFKGAHGISSVTSISICRSSCNQVDICSTGGDGCICYFKYNGDWRSLEFTGMKQVKELSLIQSFSGDANSSNDLACRKYAIGFASTDFIIWNLHSEMKVLQIPCGGWRRPHSYFLGSLPESQNCFAFVKDHVIHIHKFWVTNCGRKLLPRVLHMQYHGREIHCLCFISDASQPYLNKNAYLHQNRFSCIATGCEDGSVRLTRYAPDTGNWFASKLLGEHVGGSAVRSICFVSRIYKTTEQLASMLNPAHIFDASSDNTDNQFLLISVGAKRVLTSWLLQNRRLSNKIEANVDREDTTTEDKSLSTSFQWLSSDMPSKFSSTRRSLGNMETNINKGEDSSDLGPDPSSGSYSPKNSTMSSKFCTVDNNEDDWRYLAVTAFLVKGADSRLTVCFIVVSCSDATLMLRALVLPYRLWFDVALLVPQTSPVLALQHVILPNYSPCVDNLQYGYSYIVISGSTDGSIAFWDLTGSVYGFMQRLSKLQPEKYIDCQKRPRTGRGSQGGRWWRMLSNRTTKTNQRDTVDTTHIGDDLNGHRTNHATNGSSSIFGHDIINFETAFPEATDDSTAEIFEIKPFYVLGNTHQSGVNCLHVSSMRDFRYPEPMFVYCVLSGGDDQALHCLTFDLANDVCPQMKRHSGVTELENMGKLSPGNVNRGCRIRFLSRETIASAHSSAIKGVWTDGTWALTTGLDQRVRCWHFTDQGKLTEYAHLIISVPEPEALDARACSRNEYQIAVAGRGMQMITFSAP